MGKCSNSNNLPSYLFQTWYPFLQTCVLLYIVYHHSSSAYYEQRCVLIVSCWICLFYYQACFSFLIVAFPESFGAPPPLIGRPRCWWRRQEAARDPLLFCLCFFLSGLCWKWGNRNVQFIQSPLLYRRCYSGCAEVGSLILPNEGSHPHLHWRWAIGKGHVVSVVWWRNVCFIKRLLVHYMKEAADQNSLDGLTDGLGRLHDKCSCLLFFLQSKSLP